MYVALTMHLKNIPLAADFCAGGDKVSFTIYLTNAEDLSISLASTSSTSDTTTTFSSKFSLK